MADDNKLIFEGSLDTSNMEKQLDDLTKKKSKAVSGEIISTKDIDNAKKLEQQITTAETKFKQLANAQSNFASGTNQSAAAFAKVTQQMAGQVKYLADRTTDQQKFNQLVAKEVELRKQAKDTLASTKAPSSFGGPGGSSGGGFQLPGLNASTLAGGVFGAALGAGAAAVKAFGDTVAEAGKKAQELAKGFSDAQGKFGSLYQSQLNRSYADSKLAHNPVVLDIEKAKNDWDASWKKFVDTSLKQIKDAFDEAPAMGDPKKIAKIRKDKADAEERALATPGQLVGSDKIQYDQLKRQGIELEQDLAREKVKLDHDFMKQHRDLLQEEKEERIDYDNKVYDNALQKSRLSRNFDHDMTKLNADVEFKASNQKYELDRQFEKRNFDLKQGDERQLAQFAKQDREQQAAFATQDRNRQLGKTLSRNAADYQEDLLKGAISGSLGSTDFLFKSMDFRKSQSRLVEDTKIEQEKANRDLGYQNFTANRDLTFRQGTERRDFTLGQSDKAKEHQIDLATHQYQLDQQRYTLTTNYNDAMQDNAESLRRLTVQQEMTEQKFKNREQDLAFDEKTAYQDFNINADRSKRSIAESKQEFAAGLYGKDPYGFDKIAQGDKELAGNLNDYLKRGGLPGYHNRVEDELADFRRQRHNPPQGDSQYSKPGSDRYDLTDYGYSYDVGGLVPFDMKANIHKGERILTQQQTKRLGSLGGTNILDMSPIGNNRNIGAGYGPHGATGLVQLTGNLSNATANGAPAAIQPPAPINMPGNQPAPVINIHMGDSPMQFNGAYTEGLQRELASIKQDYEAKIQAAVNRVQGGVIKSQQQTLFGGWR